MTKPKNQATKWPGSMMRPLAQIHPFERNPRTHPPAQISLLAQLLKQWGPDQPIVVDEDGVILKGHGRRLAAIEAGIEAFPVFERRGLSEEDKLAIRIADNQVALLSGWDRELVGMDIQVLKGAGYDISLLGFGDAQIVQFTTTPGPPGAFQEVGEGISTDYCCPKCFYRWSGDPQAGAKKAKPEKKKRKRNGKK